MMPHLENGEIVHIIFNTLGVYNRLNIFQLFEQSINFVTNRVVEKFINDNLSVPEMEKILFRILEIFNPSQKERMYKTYKETTKGSKKKKEEFFDIVKEHGIYVHIEPFWHSENLYDALQVIYKEFDWIKPYKTYFYEPKSKRWVKMMYRQIVGDLYVMKLKQSSKKQLSVCSYAPIGRTGMPEKTDNAKKHKSPVSHTPIRKGIQESTNTMISISPETYAKQHMFYRSSPVARRELGYEIIDNYGVGKPIDPKITDKMSNRNVEILNAYLLIMGFELDESYDMLNLPQLFDKDYDKNEKLEHQLNGNTYIASPDYMMKEFARQRAKQKMESNEIGYIYVGQDGILKDQALEDLANNIVAEMRADGLDFFNDIDDENLE